MKGFARIFEAVIASIIIIASLSFFFAIHAPESGWDSTSLQLISQDALKTIFLNGSLERYVNTGDAVSLSAEMSRVLPTSVDFSIRVKGIPNSVIKIACADCSVADLSELAAIINETDFRYNGRPVSMRVKAVSLASAEVDPGTDILFFFDKTKVPLYRMKIDAFMKDGGNVFLLSDLTQSDTSGYIGGIFNLTWSGAAAQNAVFFSTQNSLNVSHYVAKYYANLTGKNLGDVNDAFTVFNSNGISALDDRKTIVAGVDGSHAYVRANYGVNYTQSHSVWFSDYNRLNHNVPATIATDRLLKAALMWDSGESYTMDPVSKIPGAEHFTSEVEIFDKDSYIVELTVWRVFF